jgi:hypothetical protein
MNEIAKWTHPALYMPRIRALKEKGAKVEGRVVMALTDSDIAEVRLLDSGKRFIVNASGEAWEF